MPRRSIVLGVFAMLALGLPAAAGAHHGFDPGRPLPSNNPHAFGIPQEAWEEGTEVLYLAGTDIPIVLDEGDPDLDSGDFWFILRIAESDVLALEVEGFAATGAFDDQVDLDTDLVDPLTGAPVTEDDGTWVLQYPHAHHVLLHAETDVERCLDIADGRELPTPNQHNNMHIGSPGQDTWGGFSKAGHEIHIGSCAEAGFD